MRIALISGGVLPIPPAGWGGVENLIWNYRLCLEALGHLVEIYNTPWFNETIVRLHEREYDFIHLHADQLCGDLNRHLRKPFCVTSHYGGFASFVRDQADEQYELIFRDTLDAPGNIVFSERIRRLYLARGYTAFLAVLQNPVAVERFGFAAWGNGRAICLGRVQTRKRQALLARLLRGRIRLDVAGPYDSAEEPEFVENETVSYLGSWDRQTVYERLTEYSCLVLLSRSEGDALVVKEALAAGLSVVVSEGASGDLSPHEFVTILPESALTADPVCEAIQTAIDANAHLRPGIRDFALRRFDYGVVLREYLQIIGRFKAVYPV